jgi:hypothetical protein
MTPPAPKIIRSEIHWDTECSHSGCSDRLPPRSNRRSMYAAALVEGWELTAKGAWRCPKHREN